MNLEFECVLGFQLDPSYAKAYTESKDSFENTLSPIIDKYNIKFINESYTEGAYNSIEASLNSVCPKGSKIKIKKAIAKAKVLAGLQAELERKKQDYRIKFRNFNNNFLRVVGAGNESQTINSRIDSPECEDFGFNKILVGSFQHTKKISPYSNRGKCVDHYAFGDYLLTAAPNSFIHLSTGTSFATPNLIRVMTLNNPADASLEQIKGWLKESSNRDKLVAETLKFNAMKKHYVSQGHTKLDAWKICRDLICIRVNKFLQPFTKKMKFK